MLERILIVIALGVIGYTVYRVFACYQLRCVSQNAPTDSLLKDFRQGIPAIVYFTTPMCQPCKTMQAPAIQRVASELGNGVQIFRVDATQEVEAAERWGVFSVPTTFILDGQGRAREVNYGVADAEKLKRQLQTVVA